MPDIPERLNEALEGIMNSVLMDNYNVQIGKIVTFDGTKQPPRVTVQPCFKAVYDDKEEAIIPSPVSDVPVLFFGSNEFSITTQLKKDDPVILLVCDRSIDAWLEERDIVDPSDNRINDLSDSFAIPLLFNFSREFNTNGLTIQSNNGNQEINLRSDGIYIKGDNIQFDSAVKFTKPVQFNDDVTVQTKLTVSGDVKGNEVIATKTLNKLSTHIHATPTGVSSKPTPGT